MNRRQTTLNAPSSASSSRRTRKPDKAGAVRAHAVDAGQGNSKGGASHVIRVLCVDDHAVLVEGLKAQFAINGGIEVIGRLSTAAGLEAGGRSGATEARRCCWTLRCQARTRSKEPAG